MGVIKVDTRSLDSGSHEVLAETRSQEPTGRAQNEGPRE